MFPAALTHTADLALTFGQKTNVTDTQRRIDEI